MAALTERLKVALKQGSATVQVWLAGYEWWQVALGAAVVVLFLSTWFQVSGRYPGSGGRAPGAGGARGAGASARQGGRPREEDLEDVRSAHYDDHYGGGFQEEEPGYGGGGGLLGLLGLGGNLQWYLLVGGLAYMCWKGIIPVHQMSWFQLYMLWSFIEPMLMGGRGRGFGGGLGRRRRYF